MRRLKQVCPQSALMMIYNTLSLPHLDSDSDSDSLFNTNMYILAT